MSRMRAILAGGVALLVTATLLTVAPLAVPSAAAADNSSFDPGYIISDEEFFNGSAMTAASVASFLRSIAPGCTSYTSGGSTYRCIADYTENVAGRDADSYCAAVGSKNGESAASIIARVGKACGISQRVILVTLQKENGLITGGAKSASSYRTAMGYGCPDTAACDTKYYGFFNQVYSASKQFKRYAANPTSWNHVPGRNNAVRYHPNASCGSSTVFIRNQATAGLYNYTPYQPNAAALSAGSGIGNSCSSYGNRNFWRFYTDWFGNPANLLKQGTFDGSSTSAWAELGGNINFALKKNDDRAQSGTGFIAASTAAAGRAFGNTFSTSATPGKAYEAGIWVRAGTPGAEFSGRLVLWGLGGTTEKSSVAFTAADEWIYVSTTLAVEKSSHSKLKLQVYLDTKGVTAFFDSASVSTTLAPVSRNPIAVKAPSFESGSTSAWKQGLGGKVNFNSYKATKAIPAQSGSYYMATSTFNPSASFNQDIARATRVGESYTVTAWFRSGTAGKTLKAQLAIAGIGGSNESSRTAFVVGEEWTEVSATITMTKSSHSKLRIAIYLDSGHRRLLTDNVTLTPNLAENPSFESGLVTGWFASQGAFDAETASAGAKVGKRYGSALRTASSTTKFTTDIPRPLKVGETYTFGGWFRSADPEASYVSQLRLIARGGADPAEFTIVDFEVGQEWTWVEVSHTVTTPQTTLRAEIQVSSMPHALEFDGIVIR